MNKQKYTYCDIVRIKSREEIAELAKTLPNNMQDLDCENAYEAECYVTQFGKEYGQDLYYYRVQVVGSETEVFVYGHEVNSTGKVFEPGFKLTMPLFKKREIVRVKSENVFGYIKGVGFPVAPEGKWYYSVSTAECVYSAMEDDLESTGEFKSEEDIVKEYDGSSLRVSADGNLLEQNIINPTWEQRTSKTPGFKKNE